MTADGRRTEDDHLRRREGIVDGGVGEEDGLPCQARLEAHW